MEISPRRLVEIISPCTGDVSDCEVFRAAFAQQDTAPDNRQSQEIRAELAKVACAPCKTTYLADVQ